MADFHYQPIFEFGLDETPYRKLTSDGVSTIRVDGAEMLKVEPEALREVARVAFDDVAHLLRPGHLAQLRKVIDDPESSQNDRFVALELLRNACIAAGRVLPGCQDTGTAIVMGHKGERVLTFGDDHVPLSRGVFDAYEQRNLRYSQMAPLDIVHGEEHRLEPAGADRDLRRAGGRVRAAVHRQGGRVGQQELPLPGDEGAAEPGVAAALRRGEAEDHRDGRLPALSPGAGGRRHVRRVHPEDAEAGHHEVPRPAAVERQRARPRVPRPRPGSADLRARPADRGRRAVRRQVLRARRQGHTAAPPRRVPVPSAWGSPARRIGRRWRRSRARAYSWSSSRRTRPASCPTSPKGSCRATSCASTSTGPCPRSWAS